MPYLAEYRVIISAKLQKKPSTSRSVFRPFWHNSETVQMTAIARPQNRVSYAICQQHIAYN